MHNNYYFLKQLTQSLRKRLIEAELVECFTQNKNELIFGFDRNGEEFYIKAHLDPSFCCLAFPDKFHRARKNSVDLFTSFHNLTVKEIKQFENERCFALTFSNGWKLLFKLHGNRSNIISFDEKGQVQKVFNSKLKKDFEIDIKTLDRPIDQSKDQFLKQDGDLKLLYPTFGKEVLGYLQKRDYDQINLEEKWQLVQSVLVELNEPSFYVVEHNYKIEFSLLKTDQSIQKHTDPIDAINNFFNTKIGTSSLRELKHAVVTQINKVLKQSKNYIAKSKNRHHKLLHGQSYSQLADIIMANLHQIPSGSPEVTLPNFYHNNELITISLKKTLSPQKNAEVYYRKSKNQSKEIANLEASIASKEKLVDTMEMHLLSLEKIDNFKALKQYIKSNDLDFNEKKEDSVTKPFNTYEVFGYKIFVGKNAKSNDKMLQKYAYKEDLWLHAKDVSGSHVLIKHQSGRNFPQNVILSAAAMAAYHSKRKTDSLCTVIVTPRKYVRKRKGDPPGAVVVDKEETIMVEPKARP